MRRRRLAIVTGVLLTAGCVPGSPIYIGPPVITLQGDVYRYEAQQPAAAAEVCAFGTDTLCIATDSNGHYRTALAERFLLADSSVTVRFRIPGLRPAVAVLAALRPGETRVTDCAISSAMALTNEPAACLPVPQR